MKKFKKSIIVIAIILLVTLVSAYVINAATEYTYTNTNRNIIIGKDLKGIELKNGTTVTVVQNPTETGPALFDNNNQLSILNQPNVWCVEKGRDFEEATYTVSAEKKVYDPVLAYILAGPKMGELRTGYPDKYQVALWFYLQENNGEDAKSGILGLGKNKISEDITGDLTDYIDHEGHTLYEELKKKSNLTNNASISMTDIVIDGNNATFDVTGTYDSLVVKLNGTELELDKNYTNNNGKITVDISGIEKTKFDISVEGKIIKYAVKYRILEQSASQRLMVVTDVKDDSDADSDEKTYEFETEVSLQKYITHVNGTELTTLSDETTTLKDRKNQMTEKKDETSTTKIKENISGTPAEENKVDSANKQYKRGTSDQDENAVKINIKDTVTYRIEVYNNSTIDATDVIIRDQLPLNVEENKFEIISIYKDGDTATDIKDKWTKEGTPSNTYEYTISSLASGAKTYFDITVKFNEHAEDTLENKAWIYKTTPDNAKDNNYRIEDKDYVKMNNPFEVSLEKYISKVNGVAITDSREGKAEHKYDDDTSTNDDTKQKNSVTVSSGDIVTYTIKVTNDSKDSSVYITEIADYLPDGVIYNEKSYNDGEYNKQTDNLITFDTTKDKLLAPAESTSFEVEVKVIEPNNSDNKLWNVAEITKIKAENGSEVSANDHDLTPNNNKDADYIILNYIPVVDKTSFTVEKVWDDNDNSAGKRPIEIIVELYQNTTKIEEIKLSESNNWKYTKNNLEKFDSQGNEYQYNIVEREVSEYDTTYEKISANKTIITNTYPPKGPEYISKTVRKVWDDDNNSAGKRPASIRVQLYRNSEPFENPVELNESNEWTYTWNELDDLYNYTVQEVNVPEGYTVKYDGFTIYNKYPKTEDPKPDVPSSAISGFVWNDKALDKKQSLYDGEYNDAQEDKLSGIKVYLYREGITTPVAETTTDIKGYYTFNDSDINQTVVSDPNKRYIKGYKDSDGNWEGYYKYYVVFEYDGITYTPTHYSSANTDNELASNAKEDNSEGISGLTSRADFNKNFELINKDSAIDYRTVNENGYVPQSIHKYNLNTMNMDASTSIIDMGTMTDDQLKHINLGLKGRDIFDLELTSDVAKVEVTVNGQTGIYEYTNKVTVRRNDLSVNYRHGEDMANTYSQGHEYVNEEESKKEQKIRNSDISALSEIKVTYKITVQNASSTPGTATKITNYYDSKYTFKGAYATLDDAKNDNNKLTIDNDNSKDPESSDKYGYKTIETNWGTISASNSKEIYVVYSLNNPKSITDKMATYNMAEIFEYRTEATTTADEYTRGLIDKDSAPGSANTEDVRLYPDLVEEGKSTVKYYFEAKDLSKLKYEDDTYATPTLYFVKDGSVRTLTGTVFKDITTVDSGSRIKTGNGKLDTNEVGIYGATVELIEQTPSGNVVRYSKPTEADGTFKFEGFLPGNYIIQYYYGDSEKTVLINKFDDGNDETLINAESYNGEDYQATNNGRNTGASDPRPITVTDKYGNQLTTSVLNNTDKYWYAYNESEGISVAKDNVMRRNKVSENAVLLTPEEMSELNNIRNGGSDNWENLKDKTWMYAETEPMVFTVEETALNEDNTLDVSKQFGDYNIEQMNFGIAEVPVTTVDLKKFVSGFTITDSTGSNILASNSLKEEGGRLVWGDPKGAIICAGQGYDISVSIEDEKLQGARLEITYTISKDTYTEKNFDETSVAAKANITGLVDFVDNNLSYNENLGNNKDHWDIISYNDLKSDISKLERIYPDGITPESVVLKAVAEDKRNTKYNTILKLRETDRFFNLMEGTESVTITLEKVLSSTNSTIDQLLEEVVDASVYSNIVEITGFEYKTEGDGYTGIDRIRTSDRHIILPGISESASETSEILVIHPPTGTNFNVLYLVIAVISLAILAGGVFGIKKFVIKK